MLQLQFKTHSVLWRLAARRARPLDSFGNGDRAYVNCRIEPQKLTGQTYTTIQLELREYFIGRAFGADGTKKRGRRLADARNATCRKLTDLVFRELYNEVK